MNTSIATGLLNLCRNFGRNLKQPNLSFLNSSGVFPSSLFRLAGRVLSAEPLSALLEVKGSTLVPDNSDVRAEGLEVSLWSEIFSFDCCLESLHSSIDGKRG